MFCPERGAVTGTGPLDARFHNGRVDRGPSQVLPAVSRARPTRPIRQPAFNRTRR